MTSEPDIRELFDAVVDLPPEERRAYLEKHCPDPARRKVVEELVAARTAPQPTTPFNPGPVARSPEPPRWSRATLPEPGERIGDFELLSVLGHGGYGRVYLARQVSLGRLVALKITANRGSEARALAHLDHDHIVRVFSETVDADRGWRLVCMQYVPGTALDQVIRALDRSAPGWGSGAAILAVVDAAGGGAAVFDPTALRDRELLAGCDFAEAACWLGARLAEALAYAHSRGVPHRDVKPGNILLNRYGRPMLVDFNLAPDPHHRRGAADEPFGGTRDYMAPEHLDAFNPCHDTTAAAVDERADVFSLGVMLFELLTGELPFNREPPGDDFVAKLFARAAERRAGPPSARAWRPDVPASLDRTLRRCMASDPEDRYPTGAELAAALDGCFHLRRAERQMPPPWRLTRFALRNPLAGGLLLAFVPHLIGSTVQTSYNITQIVNELTTTQQTAFEWCFVAYNLVVYAACLAMAIAVIRPVVRVMRGLESERPPGADEVTTARRRALVLWKWAVVLSACGWLPGALIYPLVLNWTPDPLKEGVSEHLMISFAVSALIALAYSVIAVHAWSVRVLYPALWADGTGADHAGADELRPVEPRLVRFVLLAGLVPIAGATLMVGVEPEKEYMLPYRLLIVVVMVLGMAGLALTAALRGRLLEVLAALGGRPSVRVPAVDCRSRGTAPEENCDRVMGFSPDWRLTG